MNPATMTAVREGRVRVRDAVLAFRDWGEEGGLPVLALHGWLDNAASFDALAPRLARRVVAVDLPGHGYSDHRPAAGTYNIWDDLPDLLALTRELGWSRYAIVGHSRGAIIGSLLAAADPERVASLVMLDGLPLLFDAADAAAQLRRFAADYGVRTPRPARTWANLDDAVAARCAATGTDPAAARMLVARGVRTTADGFAWRTDARLRYASALRLDPAHARSVAAAITVPVLMVMASGGIAHRLHEFASPEHYARRRIVTVDGEHHCHMLAAAAAIAGHIHDFWSDHEH